MRQKIIFGLIMIILVFSLSLSVIAEDTSNNDKTCSEDPSICKEDQVCKDNECVGIERCKAGPVNNKCKCGDEIAKKGDYCCPQGEDRVQKDESGCKYNICRLNDDCKTKLSSKCECPNYCSEGGKVKSKGETCGAYNFNNVCETSGGECTSLKKCTRRWNNQPKIISNAKESCGSSDNDICCQLKNNREGPELLSRCDEQCKDPDGCRCYEPCLDGTKMQYPVEGAPTGADIPSGYTCKGKYFKEDGAKTECSGYDKSTRDFRCPTGCFWFNDFDCGADKNLGNAIWDLLSFTGITKKYDETWGKFWRDLGAKFDIMYWAESICNPTSTAFGARKQELDFYVGSGDTMGWFGVEKEKNSGNYIYTINWYLANLPEPRLYHIEIQNEDTIVRFPSNSNQSYNISPGEVQSGEEYSFVYINQTDFRRACMLFNDTVYYGPPDSLSKKRNSFMEICRSI